MADLEKLGSQIRRQYSEAEIRLSTRETRRELARAIKSRDLTEVLKFMELLNVWSPCDPFFRILEQWAKSYLSGDVMVGFDHPPPRS